VDSRGLLSRGKSFSRICSRRSERPRRLASPACSRPSRTTRGTHAQMCRTLYRYTSTPAKPVSPPLRVRRASDTRARGRWRRG
jgi:hypothetical protein